ncbi:NnrS family protein [Ghiorsea bivora]|uniref:NnrS family protein n=1 Tax=Ghiorsea bivora TaxID=1485545 RepID=UPI00056E5F22|nr:NnrS family protein [Ghiorsea bivora]
MLSDKPTTALLEVGFRPFFLGAGFFAMLTMALWSAIYIFQMDITLDAISQYEWHAHEMLFGYAMAVIAGFLLTSVRTWTRTVTAEGKSLLLLFSFWLIARFCFLFGTQWIEIAAIFDSLFTLWLTYILFHRIIKTKQWHQIGIIAKVLLITLCNIMFYAGALGYMENGVVWGIFSAMYIILALILTMGRRVIPFFIERATNDAVKLFNTRWVDIPNLFVFLAFAINEVFIEHEAASAYLSLILFTLNAYRLIRWHQPIIWQQGLLWSIYLSSWMITLGFALFALTYFANLDIPKLLAIHAFTVGGIGMLTIGMMSRVSLAHTGRNVYEPPKALIYAFAAILCSAIIRVVLPLFNIWNYETLIGLSQIFWVAAFAIFTITYAPILLKPKQ